jgi:hypothetical protein
MAWSFLILLSSMGASDAPRDPVKAPAWEKWLALVPPELRLEVKPLPEKENAYPLWLEAGNAAVEIGDDDADLQEAFDGVLKAGGVFPEGEGGEGLKKLLRENKKALELVKAGPSVGPKGDETGEKGAFNEDGSRKELVWPIPPLKL